MPEIKPMGLDERFALRMKAIELENQGKKEEAKKVRRQIPMPSYLAKFHKDHLGLQSLLDTGWNLADAVEEYGPGFLTE